VFCSFQAVVTLVNCVISKNFASKLPGVGGGMYVESSTIEIQDCLIADNEAGYEGAGIFTYDSGGEIGPSVIRQNNPKSFAGATRGGGISCQGPAVPRIVNNVVMENASTHYGGGIYYFGVDTVTIEILSNTITRNHALWGGGVVCRNGFALLVNNTITENVSDHLGGIWLGPSAKVEGRNNIIWGDHSADQEELNDDEGMFDLTYCDIAAGWPGTGNLDLDPRFRNPSAGDFSLDQQSPCREAGDPADRPLGEDIAGNPRLLDGDLNSSRRVDAGAYEFDNVHLAVGGSATPGGHLILETSGLPGLDVFQFVGTAPGERCHSMVTGACSSTWRRRGSSASSWSFRRRARRLPMCPSPRCCRHRCR
jgi:hypothetical protein